MDGNRPRWTRRKTRFLANSALRLEKDMLRSHLINLPLGTWELMTTKISSLMALIRLSKKSGEIQCLEFVFIVSIFIIVRLLRHQICLDICVFENKSPEQEFNSKENVLRGRIGVILCLFIGIIAFGVYFRTFFSGEWVVNNKLEKRSSGGPNQNTRNFVGTDVYHCLC